MLRVYTKKPLKKFGRLSRYPNDLEKSLIFKLIIRSQFNYGPIVWMFCSRQTNDMINKLHERALRIVSNGQNSNFETLLGESSDICNHHRSIQTLMQRHVKCKITLAL